MGLKAQTNTGGIELLVDDGCTGLEVRADATDRSGGGSPEAEELEVRHPVQGGFCKGAGWGIAQTTRGCPGDVPHRDHAPGERFLDAHSDAVDDLIIFDGSVGSDHVNPGDEAVARLMGLGPDVGEIEVGVGVDECGEHELVVQGHHWR